MHKLRIALFFLTVAQPTQASQHEDIAALIQELNYLIAVAQSLQHRYRHDRAAIRFNYPAFIAQLRTTRDRSAQYLHRALRAPRPTPPDPIDRSLVR